MSTAISSSGLTSPSIELVMQGGFARGAFQAAALEVLVPYWLDQGLKIKHISALSIGSVNGVLVGGLLNSGQQNRIPEVLGNFWEDFSKTGDRYFFPLKAVHALSGLAKKFNFPAANSCIFPNIPSPLQLYFGLLASGGTAFRKLEHLLNKHMTDEMWHAVREGFTETSVRTVRFYEDRKTQTTRPVSIKGNRINMDAVLASCADKRLGRFAIEDKRYIDGCYGRKSLYPSEARTDLIFSIPLKPLPEKLEDFLKKEKRAEADRARLYYSSSNMMHAIEPPPLGDKSSTMNCTSDHIKYLRELGHETALRWIDTNGQMMFEKQSDKIHPAFQRAYQTLQQNRSVTIPLALAPANL